MKGSGPGLTSPHLCVWCPRGSFFEFFRLLVIYLHNSKLHTSTAVLWFVGLTLYCLPLPVSFKYSHLCICLTNVHEAALSARCCPGTAEPSQRRTERRKGPSLVGRTVLVRETVKKQTSDLMSKEN